MYVGELDSLNATRLLDADSGAVYAASGHLLFVREGALLAQAFDPARLALREEPIEIARQAAVSILGRPAVSAAVAGPIVFRATAASDRSQFAWFDRSGKELQRIGEPLLDARSFSVSRDAARIALQMAVGGNDDIWVLETSRGLPTRVTNAPGLENAAIWSPDGTRIAYQAERFGRLALVVRSAAGTGSEEALLSSPHPTLPRDWSADDAYSLYLDGRRDADLWALPVTGDRKPLPVATTEFSEPAGQFSPDGQWIAFVSNESGRYEVYVQPFPGHGSKTRVSSSGGAQVRWRRDGRELFYIGLDDRLISIAIRLDSSKHVVQSVGEPVPLFTTRVGGALQEGGFPTQYAASADGQRTTSPITLLLNWRPDS